MMILEMNTAISYPERMLLYEHILHSNIKKSLHCLFQKYFGIADC